MTLRMCIATKTSLCVCGVLKSIHGGVCVFIFKGRVSCIPGWPGICYGAEVELELLILWSLPPKCGIIDMNK